MQEHQNAMASVVENQMDLTKVSLWRVASYPEASEGYN